MLPVGKAFSGFSDSNSAITITQKYTQMATFTAGWNKETCIRLSQEAHRLISLFFCYYTKLQQKLQNGLFCMSRIKQQCSQISSAFSSDVFKKQILENSKCSFAMTDTALQRENSITIYEIVFYKSFDKRGVKLWIYSQWFLSLFSVDINNVL